MERWKKVKELGSGAYGTVCLAFPSGHSKYAVAVKSADVDFAIKSLMREASVLRHLARAPNIVDCIGEDWSVENNKRTYNLLLEYAPGRSLQDLIKKYGPMPEIIVACYASMLFRGLDQIHSHGLLHCNLKPANVLVFPGPGEGIINELKLGDFGLAKFVSEGVIKEFPTWEGSGKRYYNRGTAIHALPESVAWGYHGVYADVWAIGVMVYEMMTGKSMRNWNGNMEELYHQVLFGEIQLPQNLSQDGVNFLWWCLVTDMDDIWSARELRMHPFVVKNVWMMWEMYGVDVTQKGRNRRTWISEQDLFSERMTSSAYTNTIFDISCQPQLV